MEMLVEIVGYRVVFFLFLCLVFSPVFGLLYSFYSEKKGKIKLLKFYRLDYEARFNKIKSWNKTNPGRFIGDYEDGLSLVFACINSYDEIRRLDFNFDIDEEKRDYLRKLECRPNK